MKKKMKWIIPSAVLAALIIATVALATTGAYLSDTNDVGPNDIQAATLQVDVDGNATAGATFTVSNIAPDWQRVQIWRVVNTGSIPGYLDLQNVIWTGTAGLDGNNDLASLLGGRLFVSPNNSPYWAGGPNDVSLYSGMFDVMPTDYDSSILVPAGGTVYVVLQMNWWSSANDNMGQGDGVRLSLDFELGQKAIQ